jgi:LAO/AO transport system kinase
MTDVPRERAIDNIFEGITRKSRAHLARAISLVEDEADGAAGLLSRAYRSRKGAMVVGITGASGVGKSTLVDAMIGVLRDAGRSVGVIAVDPSSPFTGGAILGDRVRIRSAHNIDPYIFFRSLASRGHLGGVSRHTGDVIALMDAFGFDDILVETVGAGQSEVDVMRYVHTVIVVLAPGMGDDVQVIKAGILEIGNVFCINKADLPGADKTRREIEMMLAMKENAGWRPPVVETIALSPDQKGAKEVVGAVISHRDYLASGDLMKEKTRQSYRAVLEEYLRLVTIEKVMKHAASDGTLDSVLDEMERGEASPLEVAGRLARRYLTRSCHG